MSGFFYIKEISANSHKDLQAKLDEFTGNLIQKGGEVNSVREYIRYYSDEVYHASVFFMPNALSVYYRLDVFIEVGDTNELVETRFYCDPVDAEKFIYWRRDIVGVNAKNNKSVIYKTQDNVIYFELYMLMDEGVDNSTDYIYSVDYESTTNHFVSFEEALDFCVSMLGDGVTTNDYAAGCIVVNPETKKYLVIKTYELRK